MIIKKSPEDPNTTYVCLPFIRLIFREGKYVGFYHTKLKKVLD